MDPQLAALMSQNLKKQADKQGEEVVVETAGDVQKGEAPKKKYKPPPGGKLDTILLYFGNLCYFLILALLYLRNIRRFLYKTTLLAYIQAIHSLDPILSISI